MGPGLKWGMHLLLENDHWAIVAGASGLQLVSTSPWTSAMVFSQSLFMYKKAIAIHLLFQIICVYHLYHVSGYPFRMSFKSFRKRDITGLIQIDGLTQKNTCHSKRWRLYMRGQTNVSFYEPLLVCALFNWSRCLGKSGSFCLKLEPFLCLFSEAVFLAFLANVNAL